MKRIYILTVMSFVFLGVMSNSFAASEAAAAPAVVAAVDNQEVLGQQLIEAIRANDLLEVKRLLDMGAPVGERSLRQANWSTSFDAPADITRALVAAGADVNAVNEWGRSVFIDCMENSSVDAVRVFLGAGADFNIKVGDSPALLDMMHTAIYHRRGNRKKMKTDILL